jgi:hypothetical protein
MSKVISSQVVGEILLFAEEPYIVTKDVKNAPAIYEVLDLLSCACACINDINAEQTHRYASRIRRAMAYIVVGGKHIGTVHEEGLKAYAALCFTCHGPYRKNSAENQKRIPLVPQDLMKKWSRNMLDDDVLNWMYDPSEDSTLVERGKDLTESGNGLYPPGFTSKEFETHVSANFASVFFNDVDEFKHGTRAMDGFNSGSCINIVKYIANAWTIARTLPDHFDHHFCKSLEFLIASFTGGSENMWRMYWQSWVKSTSPYCFTFGFVEEYHDPHDKIGEAGGDLNVCAFDLRPMGDILLQLENALPYPEDQRRESRTLPNVTLSRKMYGSGHYGPMVRTAAYCLPNYEDIRSGVGSRQIIFTRCESLGKVVNPEMHAQFSTEDYEGQNKVISDVWELTTVLHESVGHASGRLTMTKTGVPVTPENVAELIGDNRGPLEELRAEINAYYLAIKCFDLIRDTPLCKGWPDKIGDELFKKEIMKSCIRAGVNRTSGQDSFDPRLTTSSIKGAHARANLLITNWMIVNGVAKIEPVNVVIDGEIFIRHKVVLLCDERKFLEEAMTLCVTVQDLTSTGDGKGADFWFDTYLNNVKDKIKFHHWGNCLRRNRKKIMGDVKLNSRLMIHNHDAHDRSKSLLWNMANQVIHE